MNRTLSIPIPPEPEPSAPRPTAPSPSAPQPASSAPPHQPQWEDIEVEEELCTP